MRVMPPPWNAALAVSSATTSSASTTTGPSPSPSTPARPPAAPTWGRRRRTRSAAAVPRESFPPPGRLNPRPTCRQVLPGRRQRCYDLSWTLGVGRVPSTVEDLHAHPQASRHLPLQLRPPDVVVGAEHDGDWHRAGAQLVGKVRLGQQDAGLGPQPVRAVGQPTALQKGLDLGGGSTAPLCASSSRFACQMSARSTSGRSCRSSSSGGRWCCGMAAGPLPSRMSEDRKSGSAIAARRAMRPPMECATTCGRGPRGHSARLTWCSSEASRSAAASSSPQAAAPSAATCDSYWPSWSIAATS